MNNEIKVLLLYLSAQGREVYVNDILNGHHAMDSEDYEVENFWNSFGGIEIVIDEYCTILHVSDFEFLIKVTNFLLNSLYWLKGGQCDWFDQVDSNGLFLKTTAGRSILLQRKDEQEIRLSFYPVSDGYVKKRRDKFFSEISINEQSWINSVQIALQEYFTLFEECLIYNKNDTYSRYLEIWDAIRGAG